MIEGNDRESYQCDKECWRLILYMYINKYDEGEDVYNITMLKKMMCAYIKKMKMMTFKLWWCWLYYNGDERGDAYLYWWW